MSEINKNLVPCSLVVYEDQNSEDQDVFPKVKSKIKPPPPPPSKKE